jgi:hypothetical protein
MDGRRVSRLWSDADRGGVHVLGQRAIDADVLHRGMGTVR